MTTALTHLRRAPYRLRFPGAPGLPHAHVQGEEDSFDITRDWWLAIAGEVCPSRHAFLLVLDELTAEQAAREELERPGAQPCRTGLPEGIRIAFVEATHSARVAW